MEPGVATEAEKRDVRRPMNAFLIFCKRHRSIVREKNPDLDNRSVTRILGDLWAKLKDDEKIVYTDLAKQYKDAFMKANPDYKWHNPEKTVLCPKLSDGSKTVKPDFNILPEGSITPGKLADPSNMGGLSLLLRAGEQGLKEQGIFSRDRPLMAASLESVVKVSGVVTDPEKTDVIEDTGLDTCISENQTKEVDSEKASTLFLDTHGAVTKPLLFQAVAAPKMSQKVLVSEATREGCEKTIYSDILRDNVVSTIVSNIENQIFNVTSDGQMEKKIKPLNKQEKENFTKMKEFSDNAKGDEPPKKVEESPVLTCGKMVVNHIIDQLYFSDIAVASQRVMAGESLDHETVNPGQDYILEKIKLSEQETKTDLAKTGQQLPSDYHHLPSDLNKSSPESLTLSNTIKTDNDRSPDSVSEFNNNMKDFDEADGMTDVRSPRKRLMSQSSYKGSESTDHEDGEELQPLRKSRRRNKGQRYQKLINDGIIQPSKERMAAIQHSSPKPDSTEEYMMPVDVRYNSYILPETAVRRFRKRTTSESAKDKMIHPDDVKRYKTGDFDLEAQIATLPACTVENMGRKRGFARQRHNSECIHSSRKSDVEVAHLPPPVFTKEKVVLLPPHIKMPSVEQKTSEPVTGSRKRKARKHSINHLLPAPPTVTSDEKHKSDMKETNSAHSAAIPNERLTKTSPDDKSESSGSPSVTMATNVGNVNLDMKSEEKFDAIKPGQGIEGKLQTETDIKEKNFNSNGMVENDTIVATETNINLTAASGTETCMPFCKEEASDLALCDSKVVCDIKVGSGIDDDGPQCSHARESKDGNSKQICASETQVANLPANSNRNGTSSSEDKDQPASMENL